MEGEDGNAFSKKIIVQFNHEYRDKTNISHIKIQVSKSNG
jgi:hypothetical protein